MAQSEVNPDRLAQHNREVQAILDRSQKSLRRQRIGMNLLLLYAVGFVSVFVVWGEITGFVPASMALALFSAMLLLYAFCEVLKYFFNLNRIEVLKEIKRLELMILELKKDREK